MQDGSTEGKIDLMALKLALCENICLSTLDAILELSLYAGQSVRNLQAFQVLQTVFLKVKLISV